MCTNPVSGKSKTNPANNSESVILYIVYCVYTQNLYTVVPALCDPRRERPPALYGHVINAPTDTFQR